MIARSFDDCVAVVFDGDFVGGEEGRAAIVAQLSDRNERIVGESWNNVGDICFNWECRM